MTDVYKLSILCPTLEIAIMVMEFFDDLGYGAGLKQYDETIAEERFFVQIFSYSFHPKPTLQGE